MPKGKVTRGGNIRSYAKQQSDKLRNIRRRFEREAARLRKDAGKLDDAGREYLLRRAEAKEREAEKYRFSNLAKGTKRGSAEAAEAVTTSLYNEQQDRLAREMLKGNVGSQFYAATKDIWKAAKAPNGKIDTSTANELILEHFGASNLMEVIEKLSRDTGNDFTINTDATKRGEEYRKKSRSGMLAVAKTKR